MVWVKIFHFMHGGRKICLTETRERFKQQGDNSFKNSKKGTVGCFIKELMGKNKFQTITRVQGQNSNKEDISKVGLQSFVPGGRAKSGWVCKHCQTLIHYLKHYP